MAACLKPSLEFVCILACGKRKQVQSFEIQELVGHINSTDATSKTLMSHMTTCCCKGSWEM